MGVGQRIREAWYGEGPEAHHGHLGKVGTPTMGGVVILIGMTGAYLVARVTGAKFSAVGVAVLGAARPYEPAAASTSTTASTRTSTTATSPRI